MSILMTQRPSPELMTCGEVAETGRYPYTGRLGMLRGEDRRKVCQAMEMVGAEKLYDFPFLQASDGQRQRVLLARAICQDPDVIVMDEPTSFLDIRGKLEFLELIVSLAREKKTAVILSLHELDLAQKISDRVLCIRDRRVDRYGTPEEIFQKGYMEQLFRLQKGSYNPDFGSLELAGIQGQPSLFVIGETEAGLKLTAGFEDRPYPLPWAFCRKMMWTIRWRRRWQFVWSVRRLTSLWERRLIRRQSA